MKLIAIFSFSDGSTIEAHPALCAEIESIQSGLNLNGTVLLFRSDDPEATTAYRASFLKHLGSDDEILIFRIERGAWRLSPERDKWLRDFLSSDQ